MKNLVLEKSLNYLRAQLNNGTWSSGSRLPNYNQLAHEAGVGRTAIWKAITILRKEKLLSCKPKLGIFAGPEVPVAIKNTLQKTKILKWQTVKKNILHDIYLGTFKSSELLPSYKELSALYKTDSRVIKLALESLVTDKVLHVNKRRYAISHFSTFHATNIIYLFVNSAAFKSQWSIVREWFSSFLHTLEKECKQRKISLQTCWYSKNESIPTDLGRALGFILYAENERELTYPEIYPVVQNILRYNKPTIVIHSSSLYNADAINFFDNLHHNNKHFFSTNSDYDVQAGRAIGRFLLEKGYTQACFFSPSQETRWSKRLEGIQEEFGKIGIQDGIVSFVQEDVKNIFDPSLQEAIKPFHVMIPREELKTNIEMCWQIVEIAGEKFPDRQKMVAEIQREYAAVNDLYATRQPFTKIPIDKTYIDLYNILANSYKLPLPGVFKFSLMATLQEMNNNVSLLQVFSPVFRKALALPNNTAWVCAEDYLTNTAWYFLHQQNTTIQKQIRLCGIQDHLESCSNNITSYHFDFATTAIKALNLIISPKHAGQTLCRKGTTVFDLEGMVIDRGSV